MLNRFTYTNEQTFFQKLKSIDWILVFCILLIGLISFFAMYSTDGGEILYHTKNHTYRFITFFVMMMIISFFNIKLWHATGYIFYIFVLALLFWASYYGVTASGSQRWSGCPSYVQGCHLCGFCADGGQGSLGTWNAMRGNYCTCRIAALTNDNQGARICNYGGDWCYTGETFNCIPYIAGAGYHGSICELECPTFENTIYGLRGIWPMQCWDTNHYGWEQHAPIMGFDTETQCCSTFTSGNCCGYNCGAWTGNGCLRYPAAGGWGSHAMGGGNGLCGDSGKFGMVCVQWK